MLHPDVIFFDAVGTLFRVRGSVGHIYSQIAADYGVQTKPATVDRHFYTVFKSAPPAAFPDAGDLLPQLEREWWYSVVRQTFERVGVLHKFRDFPRYFRDVFDSFETDAVWELYPETLPVLDELDQQATLAMISNFDSRLHKVLRVLGLDGVFHSVTISTAVGAAKPCSAVFDAALAREGVNPSNALHVGDHQRQDYQGAKLAGLNALWLRRAQPMMLLDDRQAPPADTIADLFGILDRLSIHPSNHSLVSSS
ncbi:MAG: HAD-IA family hydrolase [Cyanobacteria bacterium J06597_1]